MKLKTLILIICSLIILLFVCPTYRFSKYQMGNCDTLTVLTYKSVFIKKARTYFIAGNYKSLRLPSKDSFYISYSGLGSGFMVLCSCKDGRIVINYKDGYFKINEQRVENYSSEKIILEKIPHELFDNIKRDNNYLYLSEGTHDKWF